MASLRTVVMSIIFLVTIATAQVSPGQFTLTVYQPGSPLDGQVVNAAAEALYLGLKGPSSYCPVTDVSLCPAGNQTIFAGMSAMFVEVPGGQEIYTTVEGVIGYTVAHSASIPTGAYIGDFTNITLKSDCSSPVTLINWQSPETNGVVTKGILACPNVPYYENGTATYQIYANTPAFNQTGCIKVEGLLPHYTPAGVFGAWEYT